MSLILDALKKSEAERQRQAGPTLLEVRVAKPQRRYPLWALAVGLLLAVNMILLLLFFLRRPGTPAAETQSVAGRTPIVAPASAPTPAVSAPAPPAPSPSATMPPVAAQPAAPMPVPALTPAQDSADTASNPADNLPAVAPQPVSGRTQHDGANDYSNLPSFSEVGGNLPDLRLDLHVYANRPGDRYALINMQTVHEGDTLSEGARVLGITRDGVALDYRGQQFMLRPQ
jgi:general secretion pathway protein B